MDDNQPSGNELNAQLAERFKTLPKVVQDAITSADVQKHLRELADTHKLHLDQWQSLENEVMLTLLGFQPTDKLQNNIASEVGVSNETAASLAQDISRIVFAPIRGEMERALDHPEAKAEEMSGVEEARRAALSAEEKGEGAAPENPAAQQPADPVAPATPPPGAPEEKAQRAPVSAAYRAGEPSTVRASVEDDPYREPPA